MSHSVITRRRARLAPFAQVYGPMVLDGRLSAGALRTFLLVDLLAGADGEGEHSHALIARLLGADAKTVERHLEQIEAAKLVTVERRQGCTNRVVVEDPEAVYGRAAITGFFVTVKDAAKLGRSSEPVTPDKNVGGTTDKNVGGPPTKMSDRVEGGRAEAFGTQPFGGASPSAPTPESGSRTGTAPRTSMQPTPPSGGAPPAGGKSVAPPDLAHAGEVAFQSEKSGSGTLPPTDPPDPLLTKDGRARKRPLYDPNRPLAEWRAPDALGYFLMRWRRKWPTEPLPDLYLKHAAAVKGRLAWLDAEKIGRAVMREAIDHIFDKWDVGLKERLRWEESRPAFALICSLRLFERLLRDFRGERPTRRDFYDPVAAAKGPDSGWGPKTAAEAQA